MKISWIHLFALLIVLTSSCISKTKPSNEIEDFTLTVEFQPALFRTGICTVKKEGVSSSLSLDFIYGNKNRKPTDYSQIKIINPNQFNTNLPIIEYGDTLFIESVESVNLKSEQIVQFFNELQIDIANQKGSSLSMPKIDGFKIFFSYKTDSIENNFTYESVGKYDTTELKITKAVIDLMDRSFKNELAKKYIYTWKISYGFYDLPDTYDNVPILKINVP